MQLPQWLEQAFLWLALFNLAAVLVVIAILAFSHRLIRPIADLPLPEIAAWPRVSLVAPARNEERNIEAAVRSLMKLDYPDLEITLVNDRSTDSTGRILDRLAAEFPQLNVVHLTGLPPGWLGKNHAMHVGADRSTGEWLLFTDADIVFEPTTLRRTIAYALENGIDHLAATPDAQMPTWFLQAFVVMFSMFFALFVRIWSVRNPKSTAHIGIGAFNLVRKDVYQAVGGHERIRMRPDDDLKLGKIVKLGGYRQDVVHGTGMVAVEWYPTVSAAIRGLEKNVFSAFEYNPVVALLMSLQPLLLNVWPFVAVFVVSGPARWVYVAVCLALWYSAWITARAMKAPQSCALAFPLCVLLFVYIQWRSMLLNYYYGGIRWRDTHYSLAELRANKV
jgi:cellulose synthase/poly-beta-1,6-N-acetylglucosamine synthase-like glycosyltransferase